MEKQDRPELWAGIECTINRLESGYKDQLMLSGHYDREDDIDAIAQLGVTSIRYPVLWEKHQPVKDAMPDFTWVTGRLERLRQLGITPIAGLLHHGSGPDYTNLEDPEFPELFARYAGQVAAKFPWLEMYTPVNEPLTTARFSGLYGFWYPHRRTEAAYIRMLLNQLKGTVLAMREIRKVNPHAKLVQTEDMAKTYSTRLLSYQAAFENHRRFLTHDILCGRLCKGHPLWKHFIKLGISADELHFFTQNPCPPDILGVNYYCTSERYLDEDLSRYPVSQHGGNGMHEYADVEAVRVRLNQPSGYKVLVKELWDRYSIPIAATEVHLHCSREEQIKWFMDIYAASCELRNEGIDVRAVTAWSVLGAFGWNSLLTDDEMLYERGTFDVSSGNRRPTAMAEMLKTIAKTGTYSGPYLFGEGWWKNENRFFGSIGNVAQPEPLSDGCKPIVIIGKTGTLGKAFGHVCTQRSIPFVLLGRQDIDICMQGQVTEAIRRYKPWAIINAAGYVRVDDAESDAARCFRENVKGPEILAAACARSKIKFMTFSSDLVFDGGKRSPYLEYDPFNPLNIYGKSKASAEMIVSGLNPDSLIIRTSAFFSPWDKYNFAHFLLQNLQEGLPFEASDDIITPTYVPHLVDAALDLLIDRESGIWHLTNNTAMSWRGFAGLIAEKAGFDKSLILKQRGKSKARKPKYSALNSSKGILMPLLHNAVDQYLEGYMAARADVA